MPTVSMTVNGKSVSGEVEARTLVVQFLRETLDMTGTHVGCDTSQCGACVVHIDGESVKSCTVLAAQADGADVLTIEGLADGDTLHPMQEAFLKEGAVQCGYCTPGFILSAVALLRENPEPSDEEIIESIAGNLCRCTGYHKIVTAIRSCAEAIREAEMSV